MSSLIGHGLAGVITKKCIRTSLPAIQEKKLLVASVILALLPDIDVIIYILLKPAGMVPHRGITHGFLFAGLVSLVCMMVTARYYPISKVRLFFIYLCPILTHPGLDYLMGAGPPVPFLSPLVETGFLSPVRVVPCAFYSTTLGGIMGLALHAPTLIGVAIEILIFVPMILFLGIPDDGRSVHPIRRMSWVVSVLALILSLYLYNGVFKFQ